MEDAIIEIRGLAYRYAVIAEGSRNQLNTVLQGLPPLNKGIQLGYSDGLDSAACDLNRLANKLMELHEMPIVRL